MTSKTLLDEAIILLNSSPENIKNKIIWRNSRRKLVSKWKGRLVRTIYKGSDGNQRVFTIDGLTRQLADTLLAYGRLAYPYNVSVAGYYFSRHNIRLTHPFLPCIIERENGGKPNETFRFYPLELLEFVEDTKSLPPEGEGKSYEKMFYQLQIKSENDVEVEEMDWLRSEW